MRRRLDQLRHRLKQPVAGVANSAASQATVRQYEIWWASLPLPVGRRRVLLLSRNPAYAYLIKVLVAEVAYDPGNLAGGDGGAAGGLAVRFRRQSRQPTHGREASAHQARRFAETNPRDRDQARARSSTRLDRVERALSASAPNGAHGQRCRSPRGSSGWRKGRVT